MCKTDRNERKFMNFLAVVILNLCLNHEELEVSDFVQASKIFSQDDTHSTLCYSSFNF